MIHCPNCRSKNMDGALFCEECGAQLVNYEKVVTQNIPTKEFSNIETTIYRGDPKNIRQIDSWASLHLMESGQILPLAERSEFTLGRISGAQSVMPDIDLTPYQAYSGGVSRLHAVLKREGKRASLTDLGSSNGTYLNGKRLKPNVETSITHGDIISLGKLKFQIMIRDI